MKKNIKTNFKILRITLLNKINTQRKRKQQIIEIEI